MKYSICFQISILVLLPTEVLAKVSEQAKPDFLFLFLILFISFSPTIIAFILAYYQYKFKKEKRDYGYCHNKSIYLDNIALYREIPCNKDIYYAYSLSYLNNFDYRESNMLAAILLKLIHDDKILFNKDGYFILKNNYSDNLYEKRLLGYMFHASRNGILTIDDFEKWCENNESVYDLLKTGIIQNEISKLKQNKKIRKRKNKIECNKSNILDDSIYEDSIKLFGLKKFLEEFSLIDERESLEVKLWDEYLMFAFLLGVAKNIWEKLENNIISEEKQLLINYINEFSIRSNNIIFSQIKKGSK